MTQRKARVHFSMVRDYQLADLITLLNAAAGTGAIFAMMSYLLDPESWRVYVALSLIPLAFIFDVLDGRVARTPAELEQVHQTFIQTYKTVGKHLCNFPGELYMALIYRH
jgi:phosphatidylserine synthase